MATKAIQQKIRQSVVDEMANQEIKQSVVDLTDKARFVMQTYFKLENDEMDELYAQQVDWTPEQAIFVEFAKNCNAFTNAFENSIASTSRYMPIMENSHFERILLGTEKYGHYVKTTDGEPTFNRDALIALISSHQISEAKVRAFVDHAIRLMPKSSPIEKWAKQLRWDGNSRLQSLYKAFAIETDYEQEGLRTWLKGAMNRFAEPGSKHDFAIILQGKQGIGKTTALQALSPLGLFSSFHAKLDKDALMKVHRYAINELSEIDGLVYRNDVSALKDFMSQCEDDIRLPYDKTFTKLKRSFVFAGTTNTQEFLRDKTGNRRFVVLKCISKLDTKWLNENSEQIWAEIAQLDILPYLGDEYSAKQELENKAYEIADDWAELIVEKLSIVSPALLKRGLLGEKTPCSSRNIHKLMFPMASEPARSDLNRISKLLQYEIGFEHCKVLNARAWKK